MTTSTTPRTRLPQIAAREAAALLPTYARQPLHIVSGAGSWVTDADGRVYLDALCGLAVTSLGHAHPAVTRAIADQAATLVHTSNLYFTEPQVRLAERLGTLLGWPDARTFFANSGAEANEAAIKLARRHGKATSDDKVGVVALSGGFHGRTLAALLATGNPAKHDPFQPLGSWVTHVPHDDADALTAAVDDRTCAVLCEVVQGEGGVRPLGEDVLAAARTACDNHDALLIIDEVQTGIGRLGAWFGWQTTPVEPDVVCLAKALGNGLPIGAIVAHGPAALAFKPGDHATTFGGGPVVAAAALAVLDVIEGEGLIARAGDLGDRLGAGLSSLADRHATVASVRGRGLLRALALTAPLAADVVEVALDEGLIVNAVAPDAVRIAPPLTLTDDEADILLDRLDTALARVAAGAHHVEETAT